MPRAVSKGSTTYLDILVGSFLDYTLSHGLTVRSRTADIYVEHAPVTLFPSKFPATVFHEACRLQGIFNELYAAMVRDNDWLGSVMDRLANVDTFVCRLWELHKQIQDEGPTQVVSVQTGINYMKQLSLGLFRSDYMLQGGSEPPIIKQIEFNTIAASFAGLATKVSEAHTYLEQSGLYVDIHDCSILENDALNGLTDGLAKGHEAYGVPQAKILFVVQVNERNIFDQRWLEYMLLQRYKIICIRKTFYELQACASLQTDKKKLFVDTLAGPEEISVVYFRAGYGPDDYTTEKDWQTRALLERSHAIKCPSIATQLAGSKKVQQVLAEERMVERFIKSETVAKCIRDTFAGLYPLDDSPCGLRARELAFSFPERYVLKPQREGGGHNVYQRDIPSFLKAIPQTQWSRYILMELIRPQDSKNTVLQDGRPVHLNAIDELGIYGAMLWNRHETVWNSGSCGYLVRTKSNSSNEGGVAAGYGYLSSLQLTASDV